MRYYHGCQFCNLEHHIYKTKPILYCISLEIQPTVSINTTILGPRTHDSQIHLVMQFSEVSIYKNETYERYALFAIYMLCTHKLQD